MAGRNRSSSRPAPPEPPWHAEHDSKAFFKPDKMTTAKFQVAKRHQETVATQEAKYINEPPGNEEPNLVHAWLVLPGGHMLPYGLDSPGAFDEIRRAHKTWIARPEPNVLKISSSSVASLKAAFEAVNWAIHDMRLSNECPAIAFFVQKPTKTGAQSSINLDIGSRPHVADLQGSPTGIKAAAEELNKKIGGSIKPAAQNLVALGKDLKMRVTFGRLKVRQKKKGIGSSFTYSEFADLIEMYSLRGGASLETRLSNVEDAQKAVEQLTDPGAGIFIGLEDVIYGCNLTWVVADGEVRSQVQIVGGHDPELSALGMFTPEQSARLNWTTAAPDMPYDWDLRADACDIVAQVPADIQALARATSLKLDCADATALTSLKLPQLTVRHGGKLGRQVGETRLQTTAVIPYQDTPWVVEVSATQVYGVHWEDAINHVGINGRKDWGANLEYIWPGDSTEQGFGDFLESVLTIQAALEGA